MKWPEGVLPPQARSQRLQCLCGHLSGTLAGLHAWCVEHLAVHADRRRGARGAEVLQVWILGCCLDIISDIRQDHLAQGPLLQPAPRSCKNMSEAPAANTGILARAAASGQLTQLARLRCNMPSLSSFAVNVLQGSVSDPTILDYSDVELADLKFLDDDPIVVTRFTVQQIDCARDKYGNVVEGSPDTVQKCFYFWALQQDSSGFVGADGKHYPPRFQVKEMLVQGMVKLLG